MKIPAPQVAIQSTSRLQLVLPDMRGAYFWYFRKISELFMEDMMDMLHLQTVRKHNEYLLFYVGIAEGQSIRERVVDKHLNSAHVSTLRHSIGSLIAHKLNVPPFPNAPAGKFAIEEKWNIEGRISRFFEEHAMLSWVETDQTREIENSLLGDYRRLSLPLNIKRNRNHPFCRTLCDLRTKYHRC